MARRRRKKKSRDYRQEFMLILTGSALTLCALSVMYGFLIRKSMADNEIRDIQIEILNGTGEKGLAQRFAESIRRMGVDVLEVDNAESFDYQESILVGRKKVDNLEALGRVLGCRNVIEQLRDDSFVDATLIIGADYRSLNVEEANSHLLE